ncbi:MAG: HTH domain-containing protein [Clostridia bacterium]|nr:HTH domain-containing protein [Clostridia bacterium]
MRSHERRQAIWHSLCHRRQDTAAHLAAEYNVCQRTIYYDVEILSLIYPIESVRGRYHGGIKIPDWYTPNPNVYSPAQLDLLIRLQANLQGNDLIIMSSIISQFSA